MTTLKDPGVFAPPARLRQPAVWMSSLALALVLAGLALVAVPDRMSGPLVWQLDAVHGLHQTDVIGLALMALGSGWVWITGLVWQRQNIR